MVRREPGFHLNNQKIMAIVIVLVVVSALVWYIATQKVTNFRIEIQSDTSWTGAIGADGNTRSVEGFGTTAFRVQGTIASAVIQKNTEHGFLRVRIFRDGTLLASQETTAAYGVVSVSAT